MAMASELRTDRLLLRAWTPADAVPMAEINRDAEVTRYLNRPADPDAIEAFYAMVVAHWERHGFGFFAVVEETEPPGQGELVGFAGVAYPTFLPELAERPEIGWRLGRDAWGRGLATEAATAVRDFAFDALGLDELIAIIHPDNRRSQRVAAKLKMTIGTQVFNPIIGRAVDVWHIDRSSLSDQR